MVAASTTSASVSRDRVQRGGRGTTEERMRRTPGKTFYYQGRDGAAEWRELSPRDIDPGGRRRESCVSQNLSIL